MGEGGGREKGTGFWNGRGGTCIWRLEYVGARSRGTWLGRHVTSSSFEEERDAYDLSSYNSVCILSEMIDQWS